MNPTPWILRRPGGQRRLRLFCFCYAGGNASTFLDWQSALHPEIEVCAIQLPGRGSRFHEPPLEDLSELVATLSILIQKNSTLPFVFFGHSLGGLVAFELARNLRAQGFAMPQELFVSGCPAPRYRSASKGLHRLPDDQLIDELKRYNGTPQEILDNVELMKLVLPTIRADFSLVEDYEYHADRILSLPITVLAGTSEERDSLVQVTGWSDETSGTCRVEWFDGDHFFINSDKASVLKLLGSSLMHLLRKNLAAHA
jgi:medium-chain acyl-[acyl-carrier-protein] hydrolase